ncbi:hypothetical protein CERSUDRAFT_117664 [Gelatoporia subvermispora B]|uniref:Uncharacterized protein n=1 Tax=Ceriporiopsis subvermispora (strain B) TaxID=914234 RepID=M2R5I0_CERS8|nr:hypothetical protein CERSUDRAFT_117664 [Gelatoporia subvermispora B]
MVLARKHIRKRQSDDGDSPPPVPTVDGFGGASQLASPTVDSAGLVLDTAVPSSLAFTAPSLADTIPVVTVTSSVAPSASSSAPPTSAASSKNSDISLGTVIGACLGAFAGLALLILLFVWLCKRSTKSAAAARQRDAQGHAEQQRSRSQQNWNKLDDEHDKWEGMPRPAGGEKEKDSEMVETSFNMFKKSPSMRTTRTAKTYDEDNSHDLPPFEFSKYHPNLAEELALEKPQRPYASRENSGVSWDGDTVAEDPILSLRSMRLDSGTMSPTMCMAKMTPPATSSPIHKWESAEVLGLEEEDVTGAYEVQNPFADVVEEKRTAANPFFNAQELQRNNRLSRSQSTSTTTRARSITRSRSGTTTSSPHSPTESLVNPFADASEAAYDVPVTRVTPPTHKHMDSSGSSTGNAFGDHAMRSLTAALNLTQEEVEERLRVVSMHGSTISGISTLGSLDEESEVATVREFPLPPSSH